MSSEHVQHELPDVGDEEVKILHAICRDANNSTEAPFKALFASYDIILNERGINNCHDNLLYRATLRIGEAANQPWKEGRRADLVQVLTDLLQAQGITVVENEDDDGLEDITRSVDAHPVIETQRQRSKPDRRRVSFDDARLEETWLSEHIESLTAPVLPQQQLQRLLSRPPVRSRPMPSAQRARSVSSQRSILHRHAAPKHYQHASPPSTHMSEPDGLIDPTLLFQPSQTQLEQHAEAVLSTTDLRNARRFLHKWHDEAILDQQQHIQAYAIATAHDRRQLLKSAIKEWIGAFQQRRNEQRVDEYFDRWEKNVQRAYNNRIVQIAFQHWATSSSDQKIQMAVAHRHILRFRYFRRWQAIAVENATKARTILCRKYLARWRDRTARKQLAHEQAAAHYGETLQKRLYWNWFWKFCEQRVIDWREQRIKRRAFMQWRSRFAQLRNAEQQTHEHYHQRLARPCVHALLSRTKDLQLASFTAQAHHDRKLLQRSFALLALQAKLTPIARTITLRVRVNFQRKAFGIWHRFASLSTQASQVDRRRVLQNTVRDWNDATRCRALGQRIDERIVVEHLYMWVLAERLKLLRRTIDARILRQSLYVWLGKSQAQHSKLERAEMVFAQGQRRRKLSSVMVRLNNEMRRREDAGRAALEFANSRALPNIVATWREKTAHIAQMTNDAATGRFFQLTSTTLKVWNERTTEHKHSRRRDAYVQVRARIKLRVVGKSFMQWRTRCMEVHSMNGEAERRAQAKLFNAGIQAFDKWQDSTLRLRGLFDQANGLDKRKLLSSALSALVIRHEEVTGMNQQAIDFRNETELALVASALKRVQWATFTATRRAESANALLTRNWHQHVRHMLRHWASQSASRRAAKLPVEEQEPESPSLRPASRAAARSASRDRAEAPSSPPASTPGYMRTPSRTRRAGRFRPMVLPTPAPITPMAFDSAYLATTPAPLNAIIDSSPFQPPRGTEGLTPQVTPFARKLRAGGIGASSTPAGMPPSAPRTSVFGRSVGGTGKSVRFAGSSRFRRSGRVSDVEEGSEGHIKSS